MKASQARKLSAAARAARRSVRIIERALDKPRAVPRAPAASGPDLAPSVPDESGHSQVRES